MEPGIHLACSMAMHPLASTPCLAVAFVFLATTGCATTLEVTSSRQFDQTESRLSLTPAPSELPEQDGSLNGYLALAMKHSPDLRAAFERWRASVLSIAKARRLPEPNVSFGLFVRRVETRVGPQRFKVGLNQAFPWPTLLSARADASAAKAQAAQSAFDATLVELRRRVARQYWRLWLVHTQHSLKTEHDAVLEALAGAVRGRIRTGDATLAALNQVELNIARHHDHTGQHEQAARRASARLLAALGFAGSGQILQAKDGPQIAVPTQSDADLRATAREHPRIRRHGHLAASDHARARAERIQRYPRFRLGLDYIETGAAIADVPDSGKDPIMVSAGLSIPLWSNNYSSAERSAKAAAASREAMQESAMRSAEAALEVAMADMRDSKRRVELYENTLIPQGEATFTATLGGYQAGRSTVSAVILAQRDLLELQLEHAAARAAHAVAWADLEYIVGRQLDASGERQ